MRASLACLACLTAISSVALAAPASQDDSLPTYYLRGYYKLDNQRPQWQTSDAAPWSQVKSNTPWVDHAWSSTATSRSHTTPRTITVGSTTVPEPAPTSSSGRSCVAIRDGAMALPE